MKKCRIGGLDLGPDFPVRIVAELGICHRGDVELAKRMVQVATQADADYIKFEIYQLDTALSKPYRNDTEFSFGTASHGMVTQNLFEAFREGHLSFDQAAELIAEIKKTGKPFFATACSKEEVDFLHRQGACAIKLSSGEIDHYPLIAHVASLGLPAFMDTAQTQLWEIVRAAEEFYSAGGENLVIMVNPPGYPSPPETTDLRRINALTAALDSPVGFSCHTPGRLMIAAAIGAGACVVEKPMAPDKTQPYVEYVFSEDMADYAEFVDEVRFVSTARGEAARTWSPDTIQGQLVNRHGLVAGRDLKAGHVLTPGDLVLARPGFGIRPEHWRLAVGRSLKNDLEQGRAITWDDI